MNRIIPVPSTATIKYSGTLIDHEIIHIDESNLFEFGKYFAHIVNFYFVQKGIIDSTKIIETLREDEEESKNEGSPFTNFATNPNMKTFNTNDFTLSSFRHKKRQSKLNMSTVNEPSLPSVSVPRSNDIRANKSSLLRQLKKRHPNSRLFKVDSFQNQYNQGIGMALLPWHHT